MPLRIYDKVSWHFPEGQNCPSIEAAAMHFKILVAWLKKHSLLSSFGLAISEQAIGEDYSLTSEMLTAEGQQLLDAYYDEWLKTITYEKQPSVGFWDKKLN